MKATKLSLLVGFIGAAAGISACTSAAKVAPATAPPISHAYVVESSELIEISTFEDGTVKYTPSGWIIVETAPSPTARTR